MHALAFSAAAPLPSRSNLLSRPVCPPCARPRRLAPLAQLRDGRADVASALRAVGADAAAVQAERLASLTLSPHWQDTLSVLSSFSLQGPALSRAATRLPLSTILSLTPTTLHATLQTLSDGLSLTSSQRARLLANYPVLLTQTADLISDVLTALHDSTTLQTAHVRALVLRVPMLLCTPADSLRASALLLFETPISLSPRLVRALLRRAPWLLLLDAVDVIHPAAQWLARALHAPLNSVVLANPRTLAATPEDMTSVTTFLTEEVLMNDRGLRATLRSFPPMLTTTPDKLRPALRFLCDEAGLLSVDVARVVRAFPAVLTLDVDSSMRPVIQYFRSLGVQNVARLIVHLPPVLGYDVESNIRPKVQFVRNVLRLPLFELLRFPALLSYPLAGRIVPRAAFVVAVKQTVVDCGLTRVVAGSDADFCERVVQVPLQQYVVFRDDLLRRSRMRRNGVPRRPRVEEPMEKGVVVETGTPTDDDVSDYRASEAVGEDNMDTDGESTMLTEEEIAATWDKSDSAEAARALVDGTGNDSLGTAAVDEARVWGRKRFRATLVRIPWGDLP